jgi:hypothetical protein
VTPRPDRNVATSPLLRWSTDALLVAGCAICIIVPLTDGFDLWIGTLRLRFHTVARPAVVALAAGLMRWWMDHDRLRRGAAVDFVAHRGFLVLIFAAAALYVRYEVRICGGLDSYGYLGAARLIASSALHEFHPIADLLPFDQPARAAAPLGFVPATDGHSSVPRFPLGLPLVMAAFRIFGTDGPFVVPLIMAMGAAAVAMRIGREVGTQVTGLLAAALVLIDPIVLNQAIQPMSDVPATFWLLLAVWLGMFARPRPGLAGLAAGMAVLTRPALAPAAIVVAGLAWRRTPGRWRAALGVGGALLLQAFLQRWLYGAVTVSGYGAVQDLFKFQRVADNIWNVGAWMAAVHTSVFWPAWLGSLLVLRKETWPWRLSGIALSVGVPYLFYLTYRDWESIRFLLPGIVLVLIVVARGLEVALRRITETWASLVLLAFTMILALASYQFVLRHQVFDLGRQEAKYPAVAAWISANTFPNAVVLASLHSGSIRFYAGRETIRWDQIPVGSLGATHRALDAAGYPILVALDGMDEMTGFEQRFRIELLEWRIEPIATIHDVVLARLRPEEHNASRRP